jgi:hypothetical protein
VRINHARRWLAAALLSTSLLATAACDASRGGPIAASAPPSVAGSTAPSVAPVQPSSAAASSGAARGSAAGAGPHGNTAQVCAHIQKAKTAFTAAITNPAAGNVSVVKKAFVDFAASLRADATRATNPDLARTLLQVADQSEKIGQLQDPTKADSTGWEDAGRHIDEVCAVK